MYNDSNLLIKTTAYENKIYPFSVLFYFGNQCFFSEYLCDEARFKSIWLKLDASGTITDSYDFTTSFPNLYSLASLTDDESTNEIYGISDDVVVKYNVITKAESSFILPYFGYSGVYGSIIVTNNSFSATNEVFGDKVSKPVKAYNLLGMEIPLNTKNSIMIIEYENGSREKVYVK